MRLADETLSLLWMLVEAARSVPRSQRGDFMALGFLGGNVIQHTGLPGGSIENYDEGDLRDLIETRLIRVTHQGRSEQVFDLRREAFDLYDEYHRDANQPVEAQVRMITEHLGSEAAAARNRDAFDKWRQADDLLWAEETSKNLTTIGHLCREALQLFATNLIARYSLEVAETDPAKTISRLHAIIAARKPDVGTRNSDLLDALVDYWKAVNGVIQRQEHGEQKEGEELTWDDGRRVVLYTAMLFTECDHLLG